jgi:hypothetical protein
MPASSSDGSLSRATSASSPVLTSGLAYGPDNQRATVSSKNGSTKRSAVRSAQSTSGTRPEKSNLIGVHQPSRSSTSVVGQRTRNPLTIRVRASSVCCAGRKPGKSQTRNGSVLPETNSIAAL